MPQFQLLACDVALAGDILNVVARHRFNPVTYPEMLTLRAIHGQNAVENVFLCGHVIRDEETERNRLVAIYGEEIINKRMYPGAGARIPTGDERYKTRIVGSRINPGAAPIPDLPPHAYGEEGTFVPLDEYDIIPQDAAPPPAGFDPFGDNNHPDKDTAAPENPLAGLLAPLDPPAAPASARGRK